MHISMTPYILITGDQPIKQYSNRALTNGCNFPSKNTDCGACGYEWHYNTMNIQLRPMIMNLCPQHWCIDLVYRVSVYPDCSIREYRCYYHYAGIIFHAYCYVGISDAGLVSCSCNAITEIDIYMRLHTEHSYRDHMPLYEDLYNAIL